MSSWRWQPCTLGRTKLFQVLSNDQRVQHVHPIRFLSVEGPFSDEVGSSRAVLRNFHLAECVGAFSQLRKCFSKLLAWLMVLPQWRHFPFLMGSSQWCCLSAALLEKSLVHLLYLCCVLSIKHYIGCSIYRISSSVTANMASSWSSVTVLLHPIVVDLI